MPRISSQHLALSKRFLSGLGLGLFALVIMGTASDMSAGQNSSSMQQSVAACDERICDPHPEPTYAGCNPTICDPYPEPSFSDCENRGDCDPLPQEA